MSASAGSTCGAPGGGRHQLLDWPYDVEQPIGPAIAEWGDAVGAEVAEADHLVARPDLLQETQGRPGAEDPSTIVLRQQRGLRRARQVDTVEAAFVGACDGELSVGQIIAALAQLLEQDVDDVRRDVLPLARRAGGRGIPRSGQVRPAFTRGAGGARTFDRFHAKAARSLT